MANVLTLSSLNLSLTCVKATSKNSPRRMIEVRLGGVVGYVLLLLMLLESWHLRIICGFLPEVVGEVSRGEERF